MAEYKKAGEAVRWGDRTLERTDNGWQCKEDGYSLSIEIIAEGRIRKRISVVVTENVDIYNMNKEGVLTKKLTFDRKGKLNGIEVQFSDGRNDVSSGPINADEETERLRNHRPFPMSRVIDTESVFLPGGRRKRGPTLSMWSSLSRPMESDDLGEISIEIKNARGEKMLDRITDREAVIDLSDFGGIMERFLRQDGVEESINKREFMRWKL